MKKFIIIRTSGSHAVGIGHIIRMKNLAYKLKKKSFDIIFLLDRNDIFIHKHLRNYKCLNIYNNINHLFNETEDAIYSYKLIKNLNLNIKAIIIDDYRISKKWEQKLQKLNIPLFVFDDRDEVKHQCNMIIDAKWTGEETFQRYRDKVPPQCVKLLGPKYIILNKPLIEKDNKLRVNKNNFNDLFSLGGGGDLNLLFSLTKHILKKISPYSKFKIFVIEGPYSKNSKKISKLSEKDNRLIIINNLTSVMPLISKMDLYVGAAGGTLFEALFFKIPSLTFSISNNQINDLRNLEDIGHYFHLNNFNNKQVNELSDLIILFYKNIERVKKLYSRKRKVNIDKSGSSRVVRAMVSYINNEKLIPNIPKMLNAPDRISLKKSVIKKINDKSINKYLDARNLQMNLAKMTERNPVSRLHHYNWWLQNQREQYSLSQNNKKILFIWHEEKVVGSYKVLIGGWFPCSKRCGALDIMKALNWQLKYTSKKYKNIPWVAVIKKDNNFVNLLNKKFKFKLILCEDPFFIIAAKCFPNANRDEFNYYIKT